MQFLGLKWLQNDLEGHDQWPPFSIPDEGIPRCKFDAHLVILALIHYNLSRWQAKFPGILSQNGRTDGQMTLEDKVNDLHFQ